MTPTDRRAVLWAGVLIAFAVAIHIPTLEQPLLEAHAFRQTQTAFTARTFHEDGIDLLHSKVPVLGPPWEVPFEFPLFQAGVAVLLDVGVDEALANRLVGLIWFAMTAWVLMLLVKRVAGARAGLVALAVFLFSPLSLLWSRTSMIEYLALFLVVLFAYAGMRWRESGPSRRGWFAIALVAGSLACAVKLPTALFWVAPFAIVGLDWSPVVLFMAHRRGRMIRDVDWNEALLRRLQSDDYVVIRCDPLGTACGVVERFESL